MLLFIFVINNKLFSIGVICIALMFIFVETLTIEIMTNAQIYKQQNDDISDKISKLRLEQNNLRLAYIENNRPFDYCQKVAIYKKENFKENGIVHSFELGYNLEVSTIVHKIKKDGTMSQHKIWIYGDETIKKL